MSNDPSQVDEFASRLAPIQSQLLGYIYAIVHNFDDSRDVLQQAHLAAWEKFDQFDRSQSFSAWMYGFVRYEVMAYHRDRARSRVKFSDELVQKLVRTEHHDDRTAADGRLEVYLEALAHCKQQLTAADRQLLEAYYDQGCQGRELAQRLQRSAQSISNSLARIRKALFHCIRSQVAQGERP